MREFNKVINNYLAINNKNALTEEEAIELLKRVNESKGLDDNSFFEFEEN